MDNTISSKPREGVQVETMSQQLVARLVLYVLV
jgi:hypothetical protein